jgi:hypothetical protein
VPRLLPLWNGAAAAGQQQDGGDAVGSAGKGGFSGALYLQHREYNSAMGAVAIYLALAARLLVHAR